MRKRILRLLAGLLNLLLLAGCAEGIAREDVAPTGRLEGCSLYLKAVEGLPEDFIFGMDASQVPSLEASGVKYYDVAGNEKDVFRILVENGVNYIRVRVWNDPYDAQGNGYGGGNCTVDTALEIGKRATKYGMKLLVDFHYSDFWADPGKQQAPKAWKDLDLEAKTQALEAYTRESLQKLRDAGVDVGMVQVGNETNGALCGETSWSAIVQLMAAGSRAVRAVYPEAKVAVHFANPENGAYPAYASNLKLYGLDYDVFGTSYYPYWHGSLENLTNILRQIRTQYGKEVLVLETSYAWTGEDSDFFGNTISEGSAVAKPYPYTLQGQVNSLRDLTQAVLDADGIGVCYWEGTWISAGGSTKEENQKLWEQYGSGWASSYAAEYDPQDAGKWYGGCAVDNQAFFDAQGRALESLMAFNLIRYGNESVPEPPEYEMRWTPTEAEAADEGENLLHNPGFEDGADAPWTATNLGGCKELNIEKKTGDSRSGDWHYHFWSPDAGTAEFTLEQSPEGLEAGTYDFRIWIMGGDCGEAEVYAYAKLDGEIVAKAPMEITVWNEWHAGEITGIEYAEGRTLTVGVYVKASNPGAWGKIDDAILYRQ
ncbi:MAG: glycosyl hydrolase 53 family protein [Oscillospiraceae bacterium]|nr:glycosyl hydrolase 53 family protein [Oscillospiraceae bacterium]